MSVYVDEIRVYPKNEIRTREAKRLGSRWCHMMADHLDELHAFALEIGLKRSYFQGESKIPHYDLTPGRRAVAVSRGAIEVTRDSYAQRLHREGKITV